MEDVMMGPIVTKRKGKPRPSAGEVSPELLSAFALLVEKLRTRPIDQKPEPTPKRGKQAVRPAPVTGKRGGGGS